MEVGTGSPVVGSKSFANCRRHLHDDVLVVLDEELMGPGGIEAVIPEARRLVGLPRVN